MTQTSRIQLQDHVAAMTRYNTQYSQSTQDSAMQKNATNADIEQVISDLVSTNTMFSNYDVTKTVRGKGFHVMHNDVKLVVSSYQFPYFYIKKTVTVGGMPAIVHYPDHLDVETYNPKAIPEPTMPVALKKVTVDANGRVVSTGSVSNPTLSAAITAGTKHSVSTGAKPTVAIRTNVAKVAGSDVSIDKRGRGHIASRFVRKAGFTPLEEVWVTVDAGRNRIVIGDRSTQRGDSISYTVDNHAAIRLAYATFTKAFKHSDVVKVTVSNKVIVLSL